MKHFFYNTKQLSAITFIVFSLFISSCSSDDDAMSVTESFRIKNVEITTASSSSPLSNEEYVYDDLNRLDRIISQSSLITETTDYIYYEGNLSEVGEYEFSHNDNGQIADMDVFNNYFFFIYNSSNQVEEIQFENQNGSITGSYFFNYDVSGNLVEILSDQDGTTDSYRVEMIYNALNRVIEIKSYNLINGNPEALNTIRTYEYSNVKNPFKAIDDQLTNQATLIPFYTGLAFNDYSIVQLSPLFFDAYFSADVLKSKQTLESFTPSGINQEVIQSFEQEEGRVVKINRVITNSNGNSNDRSFNIEYETFNP